MTKEFIPLKMSLNVLTAEQARLWFHIFTCKDIGKLIIKPENFGSKESVVEDFYDEEAAMIVKRELESQGFKL